MGEYSRDGLPTGPGFPQCHELITIFCLWVGTVVLRNFLFDFSCYRLLLCGRWFQPLLGTSGVASYSCYNLFVNLIAWFISGLFFSFAPYSLFINSIARFISQSRSGWVLKIVFVFGCDVCAWIEWPRCGRCVQHYVEGWDILPERSPTRSALCGKCGL